MYKKIPYIDQVVKTIVSAVSPDKIILFGSHARGDHRSNSDIDLLILKKGLKNEREMTNRLYLEFFNKKITTPIDLIAADYDRYNQLSDDIGYIYKTIKQEGRVVYE
jgi:predicted nucleotidyltransferase